MKKLTKAVLALKIWKDKHGQDLIEYALMAGFVAVAAGALMPNIASGISTVFSKISSVMASGSQLTGIVRRWGARVRVPRCVTGKEETNAAEGMDPGGWPIPRPVD